MRRRALTLPTDFQRSMFDAGDKEQELQDGIERIARGCSDRSPMSVKFPEPTQQGEHVCSLTQVPLCIVDKGPQVRLVDVRALFSVFSVQFDRERGKVLHLRLDGELVDRCQRRQKRRDRTWYGGGAC